MAVDIAGSASRGARSTDHIAANMLDIVATANTADTDIADTESHPNMDRNSRSHKPVPEGRGCSRQARPSVRLPRRPFSSNCPPLVV